MKQRFYFTGYEYQHIVNNKGAKKFDMYFTLEQKTAGVVCTAHEAIIDHSWQIDFSLKLNPSACYILRGGKVYTISFFSQATNKYYKLVATQEWPSLAIGSVPMHRVTGITPRKDTCQKIALAKPSGVVLDTCMGLGYTAISAASFCRHVVTCEMDRNVLRLARMNPYSSGLFKSKNISIMPKDVNTAVTQFNDSFFDSIIHDPPTFCLAPELYSKAFYLQLFRILKQGGRMFHYTPLYGVRRGVDFPLRIRHMLEKSGFSICRYDPARGGIVCMKSRKKNFTSAGRKKKKSLHEKS